jgi:hypothetical protein
MRTIARCKAPRYFNNEHEPRSTNSEEDYQSYDICIIEDTTKIKTLLQCSSYEKTTMLACSSKKGPS